MEKQIFERGLMRGHRQQTSPLPTDLTHHGIHRIRTGQHDQALLALLQHTRSKGVNEGIAVCLDMLAHDLDRLGMILPDQFVDSAAGHQPPLHDNADAITDHFDIVQNVRAEKDRLPPITQTQNQVTHLFSTDRVQAGHGLIENDQFGIMDERLGKADTLQHPFGEFSQLPRARLTQPNELQKVVRPAEW